MQGSFIFGIIFKSYNETEQNLKNMQIYVLGSRDTSRVAIQRKTVSLLWQIVIEIRHNILIQCHGNFIEVNKFNYMLEIDILRNFSQKDFGCNEVDSSGFGRPNDA